MKPSRLVPLAIVVLAIVVSIGLVPLFRNDGPGRGEAIVTVDGRAHVTRAGGASGVLTGSTKLRRGDLIELEKGRAEFRLADGVHYEGRAGAAGRRAGTTVRMAYVPTLVAGRLLVTAQRSAALSSAGTRVVLRGEGTEAAMRLANTVALSVGVYQGDVVVDSAGATLAVPALRATEIAAPGDVARQAGPLAYVATDRWDRRYLEPAMALDEAVQPLLAGFRASGGSALSSADRLRATTGQPASRRELVRLVQARHDGGGALVGAAIVGMVADRSFAERWHEVFGFRDDGASWGIVAMDRRVGAQRVVDALSKAFDATEFAFADGGGGSSELASSQARRSAANAAGSPTIGTGSSATATPGGGSTAGPAGGSGVSGTTSPGTATGGGNGTAPSPAGGGNGAGVGGTSGAVGGDGTLPPITSLLGGSDGPTTSPAGGGTIPQVTVPQVVLPPLTLPRVTLPPLTLPRVTLPPVTLPRVTLPPVTLPRVTVPRVTLPPLTLPRVTVPRVTLPPVTLPFDAGS